ncbi:MAG: NAD(+)/NADH kinase [Leptotrichiaceae bacterium]|nr:NAD(+)/NADH kinase [Leptotrichiaceae bacterium]MBP6281300.1 NAD(+)/NADH kinase [Leptotrichiaceae bacterium]MBP7101363.1 NAD(+)/NADH kinase [Leptotrichiaceae bacterium]MBP7739134.1 NAD(+)/NADH kinase [Leptotrichiaceae bacterium]MBP9630043.1 NAD(+)/NADH kinase [Leptotrichiaceae bacterium]
MENLDKRLKNSSQKNNLKKIRVIKSDKLREELLNDFYKYLKYKNILEVKDVKEADLIISFGGDGTMLVASKEAIKKDVPIMAVNMGTLGYLAEINPENAIEMLEKYQNGEYIIDNRNFLKVKYNNKKYYALNELVVIKGGLMSHLMEVEVYSNDIFVNKYRADGVIVSTPTGSTAYSLSAGGSIVHPNLKALIITPLSPHSLNARSIVVDGNDYLSFKIFSRDNDAHLNLDGSEYLKVDSSDRISAILSKKKIRIVRSGNKDYYSILREKLKWGDSVIK